MALVKNLDGVKINMVFHGYLFFQTIFEVYYKPTLLRAINEMENSKITTANNGNRCAAH
jgi:hypothetical protein